MLTSQGTPVFDGFVDFSGPEPVIRQNNTPDTTSSVSRQHYVETGRYLTVDEVNQPRWTSRSRVFHDGSPIYPLWFEVRPDEFYCDNSWTRVMSRELFGGGVTEARLREYYGDALIDVSYEYPPSY